MLHNLEKAPGSRKARKRVGRGQGSTLGKTCGRGHKGQNSRSGSKRRIGFEGGQMPLHRRLPKRGFFNLFSKEYVVVNLADIVENKRLDLTQVVDAAALKEAGLIKKADALVKVLANGEIAQAVKIKADKFSQAAITKIKNAGGEALLSED